jgi:ABC-2 type transport system ATP-binding protein
MSTTIKITNLSKTFLIPTQKHSSLRERFTSLKFRSNFQSLKILKNLNLEVQSGEWLGIIGKNGSGKSTLLKIINNIYDPNQGIIKVNGFVVPFLELGVGFNPELTAKDNIYLNGTILGMTRKLIKQKYNEIVKFAGIKPFINLKLKNFSSGMYLRLGFSIAMHVPGDIYLLDEVLAVGDYQFRQQSNQVFQNMKKKNKTVLFVSHEMDQIKQYCHRAIWLNNGKIQAEGKPSAVVKQYLKGSA